MFQLPPRPGLGLDFTFVTPDISVEKPCGFSIAIVVLFTFTFTSVFLVFSFIFCGFDYVFMERTQRTQESAGQEAKGVNILK